MRNTANSPECPVCDSTSGTLIFSVCVERLKSEWQRLFDIDISPETRDVQNVDLYECTDCHVRFFKPERLVGSSSLYAQLEKFDWYYMPQKWEYDEAIADLPGCRTVFEIGCGTGDFVALAASQGWIAEGIDLNDRAVETARRRGVPVQHLDLGEVVSTRTSCYDAVCSFQVLEHVPNPGEFLELSCSLLKPGGKLMLGVPNADSFIMHQFNVLDMPPHHMTRWSPRALAGLARLFPLRVEHIRFEPLAEYHVDGYVAAQGGRLFKTGFLSRAYASLLAPSFAALLKHATFRKHRLGQSLYGCFVRV